jgi:hypothetical protein
VLVASLPAIAPDTVRVMELIGDVWPQAAATEGSTRDVLGLGGLDVTGLIGFARSGLFP